MPAPSPLSIATGSVTRLVKEETYYRKELEQQKKKVDEERGKLTADASYNDEFMLKQLETAVQETEKVFGPLLAKIEDAVQKLEEQVAVSESSGAAPEEELKKANEALKSGRSLQREQEAREVKETEDAK